MVKGSEPVMMPRVDCKFYLLYLAQTFCIIEVQATGLAAFIDRSAIPLDPPLLPRSKGSIQ
jgi:hypothetical protein